ncbi:MAG: PQQ-binding-like beta-propeller repeat protein [Planctomycetota bacterium]
MRFNWYCTAALLLVMSTSGHESSFAVADDWPQWRGVNRDGVIDDARIGRDLPDAPVPREKMPRLWSVPVGAGYSGPTIADGLVYLTDRQGEESAVTERVLCVDAKSGATVWEHSWPVAYEIGYQAAGPRASVTVQDGRAYSVGGMGMFCCLDAADGTLIWSKDLNEVYDIRMPNWGITAAPLVHDGLVIQIAAAEGACIIAMDIESGEEVWRALDERAAYSAPILIRQGDSDVVVCWTGESISGLNPRTGDVHWSIEMLPRNMPIGVPTPVVQGDKLFVSSFYDGSMLIQLDQTKPAAKKLWHRIGRDEKNTDALHCMISNPILKGDSIFGFDSYGELRCLDLATGDRIWENLRIVPKLRWATVHTIRNGDDEIMLNDQGFLWVVTLTRKDVQPHDRVWLLDPTLKQLKRRNGVVWAHPAIADGKIFARSDNELVCASLLAK